MLHVKSMLGCAFRGVQDAMGSWDSRIRARYAYYYKYCRVREDLVLYEAYFGKGLLCNPYAIFLELLEDPDFAHLTHIWVLADDRSDTVLLETYRNHPRVRFVKRHSGEYLKYLCSAKYLVNNVSFHNYFIKKPGQIYVNTWHGIPLKTLGFDMPNGGLETSNIIRNFLQTDYMVSASPFLTQIYRKAYKLENLYPGKIIEEGYPRLDLLTRFDRAKILEKLKSYGVEIDPNRKVVLFAPTWRGKSYAQASADVDFYFSFRDELEQALGDSGYQILIKVHQRVYELAKEKLTDSCFIPSAVDANEVLAVTDILVSDFSSIYIDFLATGRPILFYIPDLESYSTERGLYRSPSHLPGPCTGSAAQIGDWISRIGEVRAEYAQRYQEERAWSNGCHAGGISRKIVDIVFRGREDGYRIHYPRFEKKRILVSKGPMPVNGITTSLLSFLDNLDYDRFDVSVMVEHTDQPEQVELINRINPRARVICRNAPGCFTIWESILQRYYERHGYRNVFHPMYARDVRRSYADAGFDIVLDFEGYHTYFAILALQFRDARKCIWQHNDMLAERQEKFPWLEHIFGLYRYFDKVVSCAYDVMLVNRANLGGKYCEPEKFGYMANFIDIPRIREKTGKAEIRTLDAKQYFAIPAGDGDPVLVPYCPSHGADGARMYRFVTIGRFSPEKNHANLIRAFAKLAGENPNVYLYILGNGVLRRETDALIDALEMGSRIFAPGNVSNPFSIMEHCDCFILPSLHEGQPMVLHEARMLKMPIIVSAFSSVNSVLTDGGQLVIGNTAEDIYWGMQQFLAGKVPCSYSFDGYEYNRRTYRELLEILEEADP